MDMKITRLLAAAAALALAPAACAQKWEFGGGAGESFYPANTVTNGAATASVDVATNIAGSLWLANSIGEHWGGEVRLDYSRGNLQLSSGGTQVAFGSEAYAMHYDFQYHFTRVSSRVRPYLAAGAGVKYYRGIGTEVAFQPLSQFALLTKTTELKPVLSVGGGLKFRITDHFGLRVEVHDFMTTIPENIIVPNAGSKISGWMQNIVPMAGISYLF
jgi:outer membrane protein W